VATLSVCYYFLLVFIKHVGNITEMGLMKALMFCAAVPLKELKVKNINFDVTTP
jgi:hypothetical protein